MPRLPRPLLAFLATASLTAATFAGDEVPGSPPAPPAPPTLLAPGAAAPKLAVTSWVKGEPVAAFEDGKVYVIEFWATWCGPCIASIPHINKLQKKNAAKGLVVIGVTAADPNNPLDKVNALVAEQGDGMSYRVAWDADRATYGAYMTAAGKQGIPCSFVIDKKGRLAYIGHPRQIDAVVAGCLDGTWDPVMSPASMDALYAEVNNAFKGGDPAATLKTLEEVCRKSPAVLEMLADQHFRLLLQNERFEQASTLGGKLVDEAIEYGDPMSLNMVAWTIVDPVEAWTERDLTLARRSAVKAVELTKEKDGAILDTLARVEFSEGNVEKAIEIQKKAIAVTTEPKMAEQLRSALEEYEAAAGEKMPG